MVQLAKEPARDDAADWQPIGSGHDLNAPPAVQALPLPVTRSAYLNTPELPWPTVERLVVALARQVDAANEVWLYGRPGQAQEGIDVVGFFDNTSPAVYQSKRWVTFTARNLQDAVNKYADGRRPFDAARLVIVTTADASDTKVIKKLCELRDKYKPLSIDLWDRDQISEKLKNRPEIVERFFGEATAAAFCAGRTGAADRSVGLPEPVSADAVMRGPVAHLGLQQVLVDADRLLATDPLGAASGYERIARSLEGSAYSPHAVEMRSRQAKALRVAGQGIEALRVDLKLVVAALQAGSPFESLMYVRRLVENPVPGADDDLRSVAALAALAEHEHHHDAGLEPVAAAFDATTDNAPYRLEIATLFAEHSVAARRLDLIRSRNGVLSMLAKQAPRDDAGLLLAARLRACVADATGGWASLAYSIRTDYPPAVGAMLLARYGRHLASLDRAGVSVQAYLDAVERACQAHTYGDAADWLFAARAVRVRSGEFGADIDDAYRMAQALRGAGTASVLPSAFSARSQALAMLQSDRQADALEALLRYRWRAVVLGSLSEELEANDLIGKLFAGTGHVERAIECLISAGSAGALRKLAESLPERPLALPVPSDLALRSAVVRQSAFTIAGEAAGKLSDADAAAWVRASLVELELASGEAVPNPRSWLAAFTAAGELVDVSTEDEARKLLTIAEPLLAREPGQHRFSDDAHVTLISGIARVHGGLRSDAVSQLCRALCSIDLMGDLALEKGQASLRQERDIVLRLCLGAAESGDERAAVAVSLVDPANPAVLAVARRQLKQVLALRTHSGSSHSVGWGWGRQAFLVAKLGMPERVSFAERMAAIVADEHDVAPNREYALVALSAIARAVDEITRDRLFALAMSAARGDRENSARMGFGGGGPLDRIQINLDGGPLTYAGLSAAALLAHVPAQYEQVAAMGSRMLKDADHRGQAAIAAALSRCPVAVLEDDLESFSLHPSDAVRALAAYLWCVRGGVPPEMGPRLAADKSESVRAGLAAHSRAEPAFAGVRDTLRRDWSRRVRLAVARGE